MLLFLAVVIHASLFTPVWTPLYFSDTVDFCPSVIPDNIARAFVLCGEDFDNEKYGGGPDMFGTIWEYEPVARGSMVRPGNPRMTDVNDWRKIITLPDVDSWDWKKSREMNAGYLEKWNDMWILFTILTGWFERLISLMDFENAALALIDEDQTDAIHDFFNEITKVYCRIVDKVAEYYPEVECIVVHDDWGSQRSLFFSQDAAMEIIVPHMKTLVDHIHSKGLFADLHSCGHTEDRIEAYLAAGWDAWCPQPMNDSISLQEKYGDRILILPNLTIPENMTEEEETELAKSLAKQFARPGKATMLGHVTLPEHMEREFYRYSRLELLKEE